ncbi:MAG TPA: hypothetical protein EYP64_00380, partial [Desulfarculaceae bacterium]|nr:hypothetical protein [Desulfarculaceae bacterium]
MMIVRKYFWAVAAVVLLALPGCAGEVKPKVDISASAKEPLPFSRQQKNIWRLQAEQLERLGDYDGACRVVRSRYLEYPEIEIADYFSLLLSRLSDEEIAARWHQE